MRLLQGNNLLRVKVSNQSAILRTIYYYGPISRAEIAQRLDLTLPTITTNINRMLKDGLVQESYIKGKAPNPSGRRAHPLQINPKAAYFGGVELMGNRWSVCVTDFCGNILSHADGALTDSVYDNFINRIGKDFMECLAASGKGADDLCGIGISLPGMVDRAKGILKINARFKWLGKDVCSDFAKATGYSGKITLENNTISRGMKLHLFYWDKLEKGKSFAYMAVSAGIACPLFLNTSSYRGSVVESGEAGHMIMEPRGRRCACGNHGCLETYASEDAIINDCKKEMEQGRAQLLRKICGDGSPPGILEIVQAQEAGDTDVCRVVENAIYMLSVAVNNIINFAMPDFMIIDCRLFKNEHNRQQLLEHTQNWLYYSTYFKTAIYFVESDKEVGALGAAATAIDERLESAI